jgi:hypothetical protein
MSYRPTAAECPVCHRTIRIDYPPGSGSPKLEAGNTRIRRASLLQLILDDLQKLESYAWHVMADLSEDCGNAATTHLRALRLDHPDLADELELSTGVAANLLAEAAVHYYELKALRMEIANALAGTI